MNDDLNRDNFDDLVIKRVPGKYNGLPQTEYKAPQSELKEKGQKRYMQIGVGVNAFLCLLNISLFFFGPGLLMSLVAGIVSGWGCWWFYKKLNEDD